MIVLLAAHVLMTVRLAQFRKVTSIASTRNCVQTVVHVLILVLQRLSCLHKACNSVEKSPRKFSCFRGLSIKKDKNFIKKALFSVICSIFAPKLLQIVFTRMINRVLIRIKVLQIVYAYYQKGAKDLKVAENELLLSLRRSYDLYHYFLLLIVDVTHMYERMIDTKRNKYRPTEEELNPDMRMLHNRFAKQVAENESLQKYVKEHGVSWADDMDFVKKVLELITTSEIYADYIKNEEDSYEVDKAFWRLVFKRIITENEFVDDYLEEKSIYWNDDVEIIESFVIKTIKRFDEQAGSKQELIPMFSNNDDYVFVVQLFRQTLLQGEEYRSFIDKHSKNWESERVANMDLVIMQVALAEILNFPSIPISVTLNEYIDAAKYYSTPKSCTFINGVLDSIVGELKEENRLLKN